MTKKISNYTENTIPMKEAPAPKNKEQTFKDIVPIFDYYVNTYDRKKVPETIEDIFNTEYSYVPPIIEDILFEGGYLLVGSPKVGKSFFCEQIAWHISTGTPLFGKKVTQGKVLYLALEDTKKRIKNRMLTMFGTDIINHNLYFQTAADTINTGLLEQLQDFLELHKDTRLIIIDTLVNVIDDMTDNSYKTDYKTMSVITKFANENHICVIAVHHTRKQKAEDVFETISGTNGLMGASDAAIVLIKEKPDEPYGSLYIRGRDNPDTKIKLTRNSRTLQWEFDEFVTGEQYSEPEEPILKAINEDLLTETHWQGWQGTATELSQKLKLDIGANNLTRKLNISKESLFERYKIIYESIRTNKGSKITLKRCN